MCETLLHHYERDPLILEHMWFSDEALFHLSGRVNRHNTHIWGTHNPMEIREHKRDTQKLVVWCAISSAGLIGPFFFRDQDGNSVNINGENYLHKLQEFCIPQLSAVADMQEVVFQQDGAPARYSREARSFLSEQFPDRWIGYRGPVEFARRILHHATSLCGATSTL